MIDLSQLTSRLSFSAVVDILLVALIFYGLFYLMQGTRAVTLLRGILFIVFVTVLASSLLRLTAFTWLIRNSIPALLVAIPVVFQPELRRALERLGRPGTLLGGRRAQASTPPSGLRSSFQWFRDLLGLPSRTPAMQMIEVVSRAAGAMGDEKVGALIVLEQRTGLQEVVDTGVQIDAEPSVELLATIFHKNTRLHDGAVILRNNRIVAASCTLPLSEERILNHDLGTRHRAAIGVTEGTDAIAVVVSEQTGAISLAHNGRLTRYLEERELYLLLTSIYYRAGAEEGIGLDGTEGTVEPVWTGQDERKG